MPIKNNKRENIETNESRRKAMKKSWKLLAVSYEQCNQKSQLEVGEVKKPEVEEQHRGAPS
jgi:hypothetical protein